MTNSASKFKSKVFKAAWTSLRNGKSKNMSEALKSAWAWAKRTLIKTVEQIGKWLSVDNVKRVTDKAILVSIENKIASGCYRNSDFWIPKSQILESEFPALKEGFENELKLSNWIAGKLVKEGKVSAIQVM